MLKKLASVLIFACTFALCADPLFMAFPQRTRSFYNPANITCQDTAKCSAKVTPDLLTVKIVQRGGAANSAILGICGKVTLRRSRKYSLSFQVRADRSVELLAACQLARLPYSTCGQNSVKQFRAIPNWRTVKIDFVSTQDGDLDLRLPGIAIGHLEPGTELSFRYVVFYDTEEATGI